MFGVFGDKAIRARSRIVKDFSKSWSNYQRTVPSLRGRKLLKNIDSDVPKNPLVAMPKISQVADIARDTSMIVTDSAQGTRAIADIAAEFINTAVGNHLALVNRFGAKHQLDNRKLLTRNLLLNEEVPERSKQSIAEFRERVYFAIHRTAQLIEAEKIYREDNTMLDRVAINSPQKSMMTQLVQGHYELTVSYQSLRSAIELFKEINNRARRDIQASRDRGDRQLESQNRLKNAIISAEVLKVIIEVVEDFELRGSDIIRKIHLKKKDDLAEMIRTQEEIVADARTSGKAALEEHARQAIGVIHIMQEKWDEILKQVDVASEQANSLRAKLPELKLNLKVAESQIDLIDNLDILLFIDSQVKEIVEIANIGEFELETLKPADLRVLFGLAPKNEPRLQDARPSTTRPD